jgi:hypothetical protein
LYGASTRDLLAIAGAVTMLMVAAAGAVFLPVRLRSAVEPLSIAQTRLASFDDAVSRARDSRAPLELFVNRESRGSLIDPTTRVRREDQEY